MTLHLVRTHLDDACTLGELYVDGVHLCFTLELPVRDGKQGSAIPAGTYKVLFTPSPKVKQGTLKSPDKDGRLPLLQGVPDRFDIRIHGGNLPSETHGCILVGDKDGDDCIYSSQDALERLLERCAPEWNAGISLTVE